MLIFQLELDISGVMQENQQSKLALIKMKSGTSPKFNQLFLGPFINIFGNFIKIQSRVCFVSYFANKDRNKQTLCHITSSLGGGNKQLESMD